MGHLLIKYAQTSYGPSMIPLTKNSDSHIIRAFFNLGYETVEVTGPQMVLVMKLTTFAWNVHDGRRPAEVGFATYIVTKSITADPRHRTWINGNSKDE